MAITRYGRSNLVAGGVRYGTNLNSFIVSRAIDSGRIAFKRVIIKEGERLDQLAGIEYGDSSLWWVIAAASKIGWGLQVPAGTIITIPTDLGQISALVG